jgi:hypothetical protein
MKYIFILTYAYKAQSFVWKVYERVGHMFIKVIITSVFFIRPNRTSSFLIEVRQ